MAITCESYRKLPNSKKCQHYEPNGACRLPDALMCVEWIKLNPDSSAPLAAPTTPKPPATPTPSATTTSLAERVAREVDRERPPAIPPKQANEVEPKLDPIAPALLNALTPKRVEHLKRERIELLITLDDSGDVLLTPESTPGQPLDEFERLTYDDMLAIASVAVHFPGARLKRVTKPRKAKP